MLQSLRKNIRNKIIHTNIKKMYCLWKTEIANNWISCATYYSKTIIPCKNKGWYLKHFQFFLESILEEGKRIHGLFLRQVKNRMSSLNSSSVGKFIHSRKNTSKREAMREFFRPNLPLLVLVSQVKRGNVKHMAFYSENWFRKRIRVLLCCYIKTWLQGLGSVSRSYLENYQCPIWWSTWKHASLNCCFLNSLPIKLIWFLYLFSSIFYHYKTMHVLCNWSEPKLLHVLFPHW